MILLKVLILLTFNSYNPLWCVIDLIDIKKVNPRIRLDIRYATSNNFTGKPIYTSKKCYLRAIVARAINNIQKELESKKLGLKIFDGYRPLSVQQHLYNTCTIHGFVANPKHARHPRGTAVDVTLVDQQGNDLLMPTEFDAFVPQASRSYKNLPKAVIQNRNLLEAIMVKHGFIPMPNEWWHFDYHSWKRYAALNVDFATLEK